MIDLKDHDLVPRFEFRNIRYEERPVRGRDGKPVDGLHQVWISLDNEAQLNSYTTAAVKDVILALRRASADRRAVCRRLHRRRHARVLHRRQHRRVRDVLRAAGRSSTCSTCASSTTWSRASCSATSRSSAASTACASAAGRRSGWRATSPSPATTPGSGRRAPCTARRPTEGRPTSCTCTSASRTRPSRCRLCEPWSAHKAMPPRACSTTSCPSYRQRRRRRSSRTHSSITER